MKKIMIAAAASNTGKTTVSCALMRAIQRRGLQVAPCKVGPDYIDPTYHALAAKARSLNLDEYLLEPKALRRSFDQHTQGADICITEGVMGFYDGQGAGIDKGSSWSMARLLDMPAVLLVDARAMAGSAAAVVYGFQHFVPDSKIGAVIVNRVSSDAHFELLKDLIERHTGLPVLGRFPAQSAIELPSRHLGLVQGQELRDAQSKIEQMADLAERYVDLERLLGLCAVHQADSDLTVSLTPPSEEGLVLAVAQDEAFSFYYEDSLRVLEEQGVRLAPFSPLKDQRLPACDGVYLGGGYPELHACALSANVSLRKDIAQASLEGLPIYAECGGLMYLGERLHVGERSFAMCGALPGYAVMTEKLQRFGYARGCLRQDTLLGPAGFSVRGHEFHHSDFHTALEPVYRMHKPRVGQPDDCWNSGWQVRKTFGTYLHTHFGQHPTMALSLMGALRTSPRRQLL